MVASLSDYKTSKKSKKEREALGMFTLEEYAAYQKRKQYMDDFPGESDRDISKDAWEEYWVCLVDDWLYQSYNHWRAVKKEWAEAVRRFEQFLDRLREMSSARANPAFTNLPFLYKGLIELVALLFDSLPRPSYQSRQAVVDDFAGALNYFAAWEMDANHFDDTMYDVGLDVQLFNLGVLKFTVDDAKHGPFARQGRINIKRIEPRYIHPDPFASKMDWDTMAWLIEASPYDVSEIRRMYPDNGWKVQPEVHWSVSRADEDAGEGDSDMEPRVIYSPANINQKGPYSVGQRGRAMLKECWLKDDTLVFEAEEEWFDNTEVVQNQETGMTETKQIHEGMGVGWMQPKTDDEGYVIGKWVKKYPHGRYIVTSNGVMLVNIPNPYPHKEPPYVFFRGRPSKTCLSPGDATFLIVVERKLNDLYNRVFRMAQANIERPKVLDANAFDAPKKWHNIESAADLIIQVRPGSQFQNMEAGEIPQFVAPYLQFLKMFFDDLLGINAIMQGKLTEGAQLSADALGALQDQAGTRTRMKARFIESGLKKAGFILMWLIRGTYQSGQELQLVDPSTKEQKTVKWDPDAAGEDDYIVVIHAGSSLPGAKQGAYQQAMTMYREGIVDREYVLETAQIPSSGRILERKRKEDIENIEAQATGRALGLDIKDRVKTDGKPGRRQQD